MNEILFEELLESVQQAGSIMRGEIKPSRQFEYREIDLKAIREKMGLSQSRFATLIGISVSTYQNWEQGRRRPQGPAMALLRIFEQNPELAIKALHGG